MAKYETQENDNVRKELLALAMQIINSNTETQDSYSYNDKLVDVTGSLGCWGIVQQ